MALIEREVSPNETTLRTLRNLLTGWVNQTKAVQDHVRQLVWVNQYGLSPQEVFDLLARDGKELITLADMLGVAIETAGEVKPVFVPVEKELKENPDGTITVAVKKAG